MKRYMTDETGYQKGEIRKGKFMRLKYLHFDTYIKIICGLTLLLK